MSEIERQLKSWRLEDQAAGDNVFRFVEKHLESILLKAYQAADPSLTRLPSETLANEKRKFEFIAHGNFSTGYFDQQAIISKGLASKVDYVQYLSSVYANYAAGLVSALIKESGWFNKNKDQLILSLMKSIFSDVSVVMHHYFEHLTNQAVEARAGEEASKAKAAEQDQDVMKILASGLKALAECDLTFRISDQMPAKGEALKADFNAAVETLQEALLAISANTLAIQAGTKEISSGSDDLARRTEQQAASLEQTAASLEEITATVRGTAEGAKHARDVVATAKVGAEHSGQVVRQAVEAMSNIEKSSGQVTQIIGVIDEIAFQTNLLALNAGVEAARAGEAGRGFAVVASEVRALAQRSADAAKEIKALIAASTQQVQQGVDLVAQTGEALEKIVVQVGEINGIVAEIASSAQEQKTGLEQVNTAVGEMDQMTQQNAAMVEESTAASHSQARETDELSHLISRFKLGEIKGSHQLREPVRAKKPVPLAPVAKPKVSATPTTIRPASKGGALPKQTPAIREDDNWTEF